MSAPLMFRDRIWGVAALAAATLLLESTLTRLLAVAQFYHFAFLAVSLALLGFGASGALLSISARLQGMPVTRLLGWAGLAFFASTALAYAVVNLLPFDSYSIAWDRRQGGYFVIYYLALTLPFLCGGLGIGAALAGSGERSHLVYAANLLGSTVGVLLAPVMGWLAGVPGAVLVSGLIGLGPTMARSAGLDRSVRAAAGALCLVGLLGLGGLTAANFTDRAPLGMTISPYKGLSHARRVPGATLLFGRWDATVRVDVLAHAATRAFPGLSYAYTGSLPEQHGLARDADALLPLTAVSPEAFEAAPFLPEAAGFALRPGARVLVLEPGGGLGIVQALAGGATEVTAVLRSALERRAVAQALTNHDPYADPRVRTVLEPPRAFLRRDRNRYDLVVLPLTDPYRPVTSGAYSLAESYDLTVEALEAALGRLAPHGILIATRWLQTPPSEELRLIATLVEALARSGYGAVAEALFAYRGIQTITVLVQPDGWSAAELVRLREFLASRRYDLVWAPDVRPDEVNRFNRLPSPAAFEAVRDLLTTDDRAAYYAAYPFAIAPPTDDRPFFFHFFRWRQTPEVLASLGRTWQPFGGSGYLILFALLALVIALSAVLIVLPLLLARPTRHTSASAVRFWEVLLYFGGLGLAFLFVEIPLIQRCILLFGHPTYAFTAVVLVVLLFASGGSMLARAAWVRWPVLFGALVAWTVAVALAGPSLIASAVGWSFIARAGAMLIGLAPLAFLMGMPFPLGLARLQGSGARMIAWAWAVNGCASVVAAVLAAILALSAGFTAVLLLGAAIYAGAGMVLISRWGDVLRSSPTGG